MNVNVTILLDRVQAQRSAKAAVGSLVLVVAILVGFSTIVSPWLQDRMGGKQLLDVMLWPLESWRTPEVVASTLDAYGDSGRRWYFGVLLVDWIFAGLYSVLLAVWAAFAARQLQLSERNVRRAAIIPLVGGLVCDWGENLLLGLQTLLFPIDKDIDIISWIALILSELKLLAYLFSAALLVVVLGLLHFSAIRKGSD